eukprot:6030910-Ditylum_brightwellii.AAC.1
MAAASSSNTYSLTKLKFDVNKNNSAYHNGKAYGVQKHLEVMQAYLCLKDKAGKNAVLMQQLAKKAK